MRFVLFHILILSTFFLFAKTVDFSTAEKIAVNFCISINKENTEIEKVFFIEKNYVPLLYIFNLKQNKGFIITSAQDNITPVLGYSFERGYSETNQPPAFKEILEGYKSQSYSAYTNKIKANEKVKKEWQKYLTIEKCNYEKEISCVKPLLKTKWDQGCFYNKMCPEDEYGICGHSPAGCVAVAMAQILKYYNYPNNGIGNKTYWSNKYGKLTADFQNTTYLWQKMDDSLITENEYIANLIYHCGVSVEMEYSSNQSGAGIPNGAFKNCFNYSNNYIFRSNYSDSAWKGILKINLDSLQPVYYRGSSKSGGHAFVCDGYQGDFFHFNWGWSGCFNGFYLIDSLNVSGYEFNSGQSAIINIRPQKESPFCKETKVIEIQEGFIEDGSGEKNYYNYTDCYWIINMQNSKQTSMVFDRFDLDSTNDYVEVFDDITSSAVLLGRFYGNTIPPEIISNTGKMYIHFVTDSIGCGKGWSAFFSGIKTHEGDDTCINILTKSYDYFDSGISENTDRYNSNTDCYWLIKPENAVSIKLYFLLFDTEYMIDNVEIYDGPSTSSALIGRFSGQKLPEEIESSGNSLLVRFYSNPQNNYKGWKIAYVSEGDLFVKIYPSYNYGTFNAETNMNNDGTPYIISIYNSTGEIVFKEVFESEFINHFLKRFTLPQLPEGLYVFSIQNNSCKLSERFVRFRD
ncbi:MAG: C10 family peptidase [Bacteroidales bacterium]|nr:C10 family peptidase [Bacteroidales bacterium]